MEVTLRHRDGSTKTFYSEEKTLGDALLEILCETMDNDDTGYFAESWLTDEEYINSHDSYHYVTYYGWDGPDEEYVCDVVEVR